MARPKGSKGDALDPMLVLERHFDSEELRIEQRRRDLREARKALAALDSAQSATSTPLGLRIDPIPSDIATEFVTRLALTIHGPVRNSVFLVNAGTGVSEEVVRASQARIRAGNPQRAIYPSAGLETPEGKASILMWKEIGEEQRILPATESEFAVFGEECVLSFLTWGDPDSGIGIIRHPHIVRLFTAYFDAIWRAALPIPGLGHDADDDHRLIELLDLGVKDEGIARQLGVSLRTVRRRIAVLMDDHGVDTRFQLGVALAQARVPALDVRARWSPRHPGLPR